jgi:hypothetical protein
MTIGFLAAVVFWVALFALLPWWLPVALMVGGTTWVFAEALRASELPDEQEPAAPVVELNAFAEFDEVRERSPRRAA